jgi:hypothetical protein
MNEPIQAIRRSIPCMVYLKLDVFEKIETDRGYQSRTQYLSELIEKGIEQK